MRSKWKVSFSSSSSLDLKTKYQLYVLLLTTLTLSMLMYFPRAYAAATEEESCDYECEYEFGGAEDSSLRRLLAGGKTISYGAVKKDLNTCSSGNGQPYGKKCGHDPVNKYRRGCQPIYGCRS